MSDYPCYKCEKMIKSHEPRFFHLIKEENTMSWTCEECHKQLMNEYQEKILNKLKDLFKLIGYNQGEMKFIYKFLDSFRIYVKNRK